MQKRRLAFVGTGGRGIGSFMRPLKDEFPDDIDLVGMFDPNPGRMAVANEVLEADVPAFSSFSEMLEGCGPDAVVICSMDSTHAEYVVAALEAGLDVFSEKPLCTTFDQVRDIRAAAAGSTGVAMVTHNMRFGPDAAALKQALLFGTIGEVRHVRFSEFLDRYHGADYFRRWHRQMANSGGLMIHKASHHFDLINWLVDALPARVTAHGRLAFYGTNGPFRSERCRGCPHFEACEFSADLAANDGLKRLYLDQEHYDGYHRDGCVFDEGIDIYDTVNGSITYESGVEASYSLVAYGCYEAVQMSIEGTLGRLALDNVYGTSWAFGYKEGAGSLMNDGDDDRTRKRVTIYRPDGRIEDITPPPSEGGHGGADPELRKMLFSTEPIADPLSQKAPLEAGIQAVLVGLAFNQSIANGSRPVDVQAA